MFNLCSALLAFALLLCEWKHAKLRPWRDLDFFPYDIVREFKYASMRFGRTLSPSKDTLPDPQAVKVRGMRCCCPLFGPNICLLENLRR
ncbi:hypothetical protein GYMLUDRAFT_37881 [Collybiopsis luxurians FD-317 M1]|nr:hypothetical protein GYMLUDRAFT_37881 [Collybiopsis luxurians FD-317 M1]